MSNPFDRYQRGALQHEAAKTTALPAREPIFEEDLAALLNRYSSENESGTPDFILADYLKGCLEIYNRTLKARAAWRGESVDLPGLKEESAGNDRPSA